MSVASASESGNNGLQAEGSVSHSNSEEGQQHEANHRQENSNASTAEPSVQARQRRRIAQLEEQLQVLESGRAVKEK
jgi:hypothetical protein